MFHLFSFFIWLSFTHLDGFKLVFYKKTWLKSKKKKKEKSINVFF